MLVLIAILLVTGFFISQLRHLEVDTSNEGFLHDNDPILITYNEFRDQFGRDDMLVIAIKSETIFTTPFLEKLARFHEELEESVPHVTEITSMVNARNTRGEGDVLLVDDLLADFPENRAELRELQERVLTNPLYQNQLISNDGSFTTIVIESDVYAQPETDDDLLSGFDEPAGPEGEEAGLRYLSDTENAAMVETVQDIAKQYEAEDFQIYLAGTPIVTHTVKQFMMSDMKRFMKLVILVIGVCLFVMFRRVSGVIAPLLVVVLTLLATLGVMSLTGVKLKVPSTILPSFLLAVGVGDSVHVLALVYLYLRQGRDKRGAIVESLSHSGLALVMTSLTTAAGLASFAFAKVAPIADLGLFSAIGVMIALLYTFTFLPAFLSFLPLKEPNRKETSRATVMDAAMSWIATFSVGHYRIVLCFFGLLVAIGVIGLFQVRFSHDVLKWLPQQHQVRVATEVINTELKGSVVLEMVLDTGRENGLYDRQTLLDIDRVVSAMEKDYRDSELFIGKSISLTTILKEIHQALHENDPSFYIIPENERLIPQELLLFENSGSDDLEDVVDSQFRLARITVKVPWTDALYYTPFIADAEQRFQQEFGGRQLEGGEPMQVTVTGIMALFGRIIYAAIYSAAQSYGIAFAIITLLMVILIGELRLGLIGMLPNLGPILIVLGMTGWLNIPLNMFTMLVASIAIGLSVDNTIHFMYNFKRYYGQTGDILTAVNSSLLTAGRALLTTTVVLSIGFFIFTFASMNNLFEFGLLTGTAILLALASNFFMAPALLTLVINRRQDPATNGDQS